MLINASIQVMNLFFIIVSIVLLLSMSFALADVDISNLSYDELVSLVNDGTIELPKKEIVEEYNLCSRSTVYISPVFGGIEPKDIVDYMLHNNLNDVRLQLQLHKYIWDPNARGV